MENRSELIPSLVIWMLVVALVLRNQWSSKIPTVGLPLAYLLNLSLIHFTGALIWALPWYNPKSAYLLQAGADYTEVALGFIESVYGVMGFGLGSTILAHRLLEFWQPRWLEEVPQSPDIKLPNKLLLFGSFFFLVIFPTIGRIPGFQGISTAGVYLFVVGICLACWRSWYQQDRKTFFLWIGVSSLIPVVTVTTLGFIGYGAAAVLTILIFISSFYRPSWHTLLISFLVLALGLSVYVTYMRDRGDIRATVWGGESLESRYGTTLKTFTNFEIIDFTNQSHLEVIDGRLNQNALVGKGVQYINGGNITFASGATIVDAALGFIPRILWPDKPAFAGSGSLTSLYTGQKFGKGTSVGVGQVLELYLNFGSIGVFLGFMVLGIIIRVVDITAGHKLFCGNWLGFVSWFLPGLGLLQPGGVLAEMTGAVAAALVLVIIIGFTTSFLHEKL